MITDIILILHLKISDNTAYTGYTGKVLEDMFWEGYMHLIQLIYIRVQIDVRKRTSSVIINYVIVLTSNIM